MERRAADFATGVRDAINSNNTTLSLPTGSYSLVHASAIPSPSYSTGQTTGNVLSFGQGIVQMLAGGTTAAGGTAGGVVTAPTGAGAVAGYAVAAVGVAVHGYSTASNAARNLFSDNNGRVNASSSNSNSQGKRKFGNKDRAEGFEKSRGGNGTPKCEYCDGELHPDKGYNNSYEADHRDSYAKGGKSEQSSLAPFCRDYNRSKGKRELNAEWAPPKSH